MIDQHVLFMFFVSSVVLSLSPGPDNLFVMAQSARNGRLAGMMVTLGLCTGLVLHTLAVAFGLAALVAASAVAFTVLKFAGAAYLLFLAWKAFHADVEKDSSDVSQVERGKLYRRGIVMNISNPKVSLFFLAFLPQFADPKNGPLVPQLLFLGAIFIVAALLVFSLLSFVAGGAGARFRRSAKARRVVNRIAGTIFAGFALKLLFTER
ncbi:MAG: LysE family translocator [Chlorobium sp.]|jgi:RhtB (resistance to homoserine/threonine) family protein|nr:LysE family translocator [Chlorobium sp.]